MFAMGETVRRDHSSISLLAACPTSRAEAARAGCISSNQDVNLLSRIQTP